MFNFFNRKPQSLFEGLCDMHNHLLPGIDDGSKDLSMSIKMLESYHKLGFKSVIPTPHIYQDLYPNTPKSISDSFKQLREVKSLENVPSLDFYGAEYMVDETFMKNLEIGVPSLILCSRYLLLEINFFGGTQLLDKACFQLLQKKTTPILAHPERYMLIDKLDQFKDLKEKGFYFQLNALSLMGHYGRQVKQKAEMILNAGLYDFVATDAHHNENLEKLKLLRISKKQRIKWQAIREFQLDIF